MEHMGAEGQWTSLSGIYTAEEADFMALLLSNSVPSSSQLLSSIGTSLPSFWPGHEASSPNISGGNYGGSNCTLELSNSSFYSSTASGDNSASVFPTSSNEQYCLSTDDHHSDKNSNSPNNCAASVSFDFGVGDLKAATNSYLVEGAHEDCDEIVGGSSEVVAQDRSRASDENNNSAKRTRYSQNVDVGKRNVRSRKKQKSAASFNNDEEGTIRGANNGQSSSSCYTGDESIKGGQEMSGGDTSSLSPKGLAALNSDGKTSAQRGSATDPQSLYARKRRERINERLRILQNLVPNGTKVDISTMLEEAVQYVKFLQLQIKLLSSDELWMYAPIAYNGKEIGLDHLKLAMAAKQS